MARRGENIHKRKDGRWEGRYIKARTPEGKIQWGYVYGTVYAEVKRVLIQKKAEAGFYNSVKGRGLLLLDFNQVWGDGTTISFYRVSVPFLIFNYPRSA